MDVEAAPVEDQPVTELVGELALEVATLVKQELALAGAEMERKGRDAMTYLWRMVIGGAIGVVGMVVLAGALVMGLATAIPSWAAAAIIGVLVTGIALSVFRSGSTALRAMSIMPTETFASLQEDKLWAKDEIGATRDQMSETLGEVRRRMKSLVARKRKRAPAKRKRPPA